MGISASLTVFLLFLVQISFAQSPITTIDEYNNNLPFWGTSWTPGDGALNGYYPSFYTGFSIRSEFPERIHVRLSRGNQTRVSVIIDDQTLNDYLFHLVKRNNFYKQLSDNTVGFINLNPKGGQTVPQLEYYSQILESPKYGIVSFVEKANSATLSEEEIYEKSLAILSELNPGRVFNLNLNLTNEFKKWRQQLQKNLLTVSDISKHYQSKPSEVVIAINSLLWGRINMTEQPTPEILEKLNVASIAAVSGATDDKFLSAALDLFLAVTKSKYDFLTLKNGKLEKALQCTGPLNCFLSYPEFTAVYPTGSLMASTNDSFKNKINLFATPGLWNFIDRSYHDVDQIRDEAYYGWAPKMNFESVGNGFHNPAVRLSGVTEEIKKILGMDQSHSVVSAVMRGRVSHGCLRLPLGHIWEMRNIFPTENAKMNQVYYFGNQSQDFDLYDVDGDSSPEIIGVEYTISYHLQGNSGLATREGAGLKVNSDEKRAFYDNLYGAKGIFTFDNDNYVFEDPTVSFPSYIELQKEETDPKRKVIAARLKVEGNFMLYEQAYEKDKIQFYAPKTAKVINDKKLRSLTIRLLGRVKGCAPTSNKNTCGETVFDLEAKNHLDKIK